MMHNNSLKVSFRHRLAGALCLSLCGWVLGGAAAPMQRPPLTDTMMNEQVKAYDWVRPQADYVRKVVMIPMRDGKKLYTVIVYRKGVSDAPILLSRTPYNADKSTSRNRSQKIEEILPVMDAEFVNDGYIRVYQDVRGLDGSEGDYVIVRAGSLNGAPAFDTETLLPYIFKGSVTGDNSAGTVTLSIAAKSVSELGLSGSTARAYDAIFNALDNDSDIADAYLGISDGSTLNANLRQMLPDHAGGTFEAVTSGSRATARILSDPNGIYRTKDGRLGFWLQQVAFGSAKSVGSTASYDINGWGAGGGVEYLTGLGAFGGSFAYIHGSDSSGSSNNAVDSDQYELAAHWRGQWGPLLAFARLSAAKINFSGTRHFENGDVTRTADGEWDGDLYSATAGLSYQLQFNRFSLRPAVGIDYYRLKEDGYAETGGGDAFNLTVLDRTSDETTANGTVTAGYDFGSLNPADGWVRLELEGGRRQIIGGSLGDTTAYFKDGDQFTLVAEDRTNGWTGRARLYGGTDTFRIGGEFGAEEQQNHVAISFRATVNFVL